MSIFDDAKAKLEQDMLDQAGQKMEQVLFAVESKARYKERVEPYRKNIENWLNEAAADFIDANKGGASIADVDSTDHGTHYSLGLEVRFTTDTATVKADRYRFLIRIDGERVSFFGIVTYPMREFGNTEDFFRNDGVIGIFDGQLKDQFDRSLLLFVYKTLETARLNGVPV